VPTYEPVIGPPPETRPIWQQPAVQGRALQAYQDVLCHRCNHGYYPLIGLCLECPERGATVRNVGTAIGIYGAIWLLWLFINRFICEELIFMDTICNFCQVLPLVYTVANDRSRLWQVTGTLGSFGLNWPGRFSHLVSRQNAPQDTAMCDSVSRCLSGLQRPSRIFSTTPEF
jgi:hypothetical protein